MNYERTIFATVLFVTSFAASNLALAETRKWLDSTGKHQTIAEFIAIDGDQVVLEKEGGKQIRIPIDKLSKPDQKYARRQAENTRKKVKEKEAKEEPVASLPQEYLDYIEEIRPEEIAKLRMMLRERRKSMSREAKKSTTEKIKILKDKKAPYYPQMNVPDEIGNVDVEGISHRTFGTISHVTFEGFDGGAVLQRSVLGHAVSDRKSQYSHHLYVINGGAFEIGRNYNPSGVYRITGSTPVNTTGGVKSAIVMERLDK